MNFTAPLCQPSLALPLAIAAIVLLSIFLIVLAAWPLCDRRDDVDPHGEAYGDQPQVPL
jgi:hypothetical protein